jgi:hypothetical protein
MLITLQLLLLIAHIAIHFTSAPPAITQTLKSFSHARKKFHFEELIRLLSERLIPGPFTGYSPHYVRPCPTTERKRKCQPAEILTIVAVTKLHASRPRKDFTPVTAQP